MDAGNPPGLARLTRRQALKTGTIVAAGAWIAPAILSLDRAEAAVGSCGIKPLQVSFGKWAGAIVPGTFVANDGTVVTMTMTDPSGVQDAFWAGRAYWGILNGVATPMITGMTGASGGAGVTISFQFSRSVEPSFTLVDVDASVGSWRDDVKVTGDLSWPMYPGGTGIAPASMATGLDVVNLPPDTVRGVNPSSSSASNVIVDFQRPINTLTITHFDTSAWTGFQWIGLADMYWC